MTNSYSRACTEVLVLLKTYLNDKDYNKIPRDVINFYEKNRDFNYIYKINPNLPLEQQEISEKANAIIITIFRDYFASESQKQKLETILINNDKIIEERKRDKYNPDNIFTKEEIIKKENNDNIQIIEYKKTNIFQKLYNKIKDFLQNKDKDNKKL